MQALRHLCLCALAVSGFVGAQDADPTYSSGDVVRIVATHVGPVANPSETYPFYVLPYCPPKDGELDVPTQALGEAFAGDRKMNTPYELKFMQDETDVVLCEREMNEEDIVSAISGRGTLSSCIVSSCMRMLGGATARDSRSRTSWMLAFSSSWWGLHTR